MQFVTGDVRSEQEVVGIDRREIALLLAIAFLYPIVECAIAFPTPYIDLREQINWGLQFPLYTWKHPPLQSWIVGLVALTGARDAWPYMLVAQILNFIGFYYVATTARILLDKAGADVALVALGSGLFFIASTSTNALNADQLLFPLWSGALYHSLQALRHDRWRDWIALGILAGLSLLAKYFSALLIVALTASLVWAGSLRRVFRNPGFYVAGLICGFLCLPTAIAVLGHQTSLQYGLGFFRPDVFNWHKVTSVALLLASPLIYGVPFLIAVAVSIWRNNATLHLRLDNGEQRLVIGTALLLFASIFLLILVAGLEYLPRYFGPLYGFGILGLLCTVRIAPVGLRHCLRVALWSWAVFLVGTVAYAMYFVNDRLREPAPAAAAILQDEWNSQFSCGPAYLLGDPLSAYAIAPYFTRDVVGVSVGDYLLAQWVDRERLRRFGAILISTPAQEATLNWFSAIPNQSPRATMELPFRRTLSTRKQVYVYSFIAPANCG